MKNMKKLSIIALILFSSLKLFSNYENNFENDNQNLKAENQKKIEEISDWEKLLKELAENEEIKKIYGDEFTKEFFADPQFWFSKEILGDKQNLSLFSKEILANMNNMIVAFYAAEAWKTGRHNENIKIEDEAGLKLLKKTFIYPKGLVKFREYLVANKTLKFLLKFKETKIANSSLFKATITKDGDLLLEIANEEGVFETISILHVLRQLTLFLNKYEFAFDSHNPFLISMTDEELENYKNELDEAIVEFSNYDFESAEAEYRYAMKQFSVGLGHHISKYTKSSSRSFMESLATVSALESATNWARKHQRCSPRLDASESDALTRTLAFFQSVIRDMKCEFENFSTTNFPLPQPKCSADGRKLELNKLQNAFFWLCGSEKDQQLMLQKLELLESKSKYRKRTLFGKRKRNAYYENLSPYGKLMKKKRDAYKTLTGKHTTTFIENASKAYCESIDPSKAMVRIDAFWKVWGPVCDSGVSGSVVSDSSASDL